MRTPPYLEDLIKSVEASCELSRDEEYVRRMVEIISCLKSRVQIFGAIDTIDSGSVFATCQGGPRKRNKLGTSIYLKLSTTYTEKHCSPLFFADKYWYEVDKLLEILKEMIPDYVMTD